MKTYRVTARRSGDWWALEVPDLPGVFSQAKRLDSADSAAREAIAAMLDVGTDTIAVTIDLRPSATESPQPDGHRPAQEPEPGSTCRPGDRPPIL